MKIKTRILALVVAFACIMPMTGFMEEVKDSSEIKDSSDEMAQALTENYGVTSLQYALIDNGEIVKSDKAGVYSKTENRALTNEIMYGIGSISKMYTTAAVMKLVDNEKLELDTPLVNYIPEFVMADSRYKLITPRMLLNHSAGLYGTGYNRSFLFDDNDTFAHDNLLNRLASENLKADPGAFSVYCNDGFTLAEILVEKVSGISFTEFLDKEFFTPLNLKNTKTPLSDFDHKNLAKTYSPFDGTATLRDTINVIGAGGVYSTAEEVCKFGDLLTGRYPELLSKESVEAMQQSEYLKGVWPDSEDSIIGYGLGWDSVNMYPFNQYGIKAYTKGGDTGLYHASIVSVPQYNISATVLESGGSSIFATIMASQMILERLLERGVIDEIKEQMTFTAPVKTPMPEGIESFSGAYAATGNGINVKISNDEVRVDTTPEQVFVHTKDGIFESPDGSTSISFVLEDNGLTYLHMKTYMTLPGVGQTIIDEYNAQKLEKNPITDEVKAIWNERNGKRYFTLNDKKTSELMLTMPSKVVKVDAENGYASACKIIDENTAVNFVQIPGMNGRDSFDLNFYEENNKKYLKDLDNIRICEDSVDPVWVGSGGVCTILDNGYLRWYTVPTEAVGMRMTVKMPSKAEIFVYDEKGMIVKPETVTDGCSIILPNNGMIVFAGDIGDVFGIDIEQ